MTAAEPIQLNVLADDRRAIEPMPNPADAAEELPVIDARDLGVRYSLRFTRKTTIRHSFANLLRRGERPSRVLGAPRRHASGS